MAIDAYEFWLSHLESRAKGTRETYVFRFNDFLKWVGKSPNELFDLKRDSLRAADPRESEVVEGFVIRYLTHLEERGLSANTRLGRLIAIHSFFDLNRVPLDHKAIRRPPSVSGGSKIPSKQEIRALLVHARSRRVRAAILSLKDCGFRPSDLVKLRWEEKVDYGEGFWGFKPIVTQKRRVLAFPFLGPEATEAVSALPRTGERIFPISAKTLKNNLYAVLDEVKFKGLSGHGLRKFFICELRNARVPQDFIYMMCGKSTGDMGAYSEKRPEELLKAYREAYSSLQVFGAAEPDERVTALETDNEYLRREVEELRRKVDAFLLLHGT